ncbi:MAG: hypothetical protein ACYDHH_18495 [Solirubrobacteraceae bacterium]
MKLKRSPVHLLSLGVLVATSAMFGAAGSASAGLLAGSATNCSSGPMSQVFLPWGDLANYDLAPGGSFEAGAPSWSLSGGAAVTAGNESFYVGGTGDSSSLSLPDGSSATSPTFCVGIQNPTIRMFAVNTGSATSSLAVYVHFVGPLGLPLTTQIGTVSSTGSWQPTAQMPIVANLLTLLPGNMTPVSMTVVPQGSGGKWQIDDVYVDPFGRG